MIAHIKFTATSNLSCFTTKMKLISWLPKRGRIVISTVVNKHKSHKKCTPTVNAQNCVGNYS